MKLKHWIFSALLVFSVGLSACDGNQADSSTTTASSENVDFSSTEASKNNTAETEDNQADSLAELDYEGTQTIDVNSNEPTFDEKDLSLENNAWEQYGDLDELNRATSAEAMLNQSTMPSDNEDRGAISNVEPTGWKNKKIEGGYLYNRSHLIGWALSGENDNWKNLITGTRQLNSPEMVRFEMDTKNYLEQSEDNYVRYSVTPIFRGDELLPRGVHIMAQSIGDNEISFNKYIFNVQDGVRLDYSDGSSEIDESINVTEDQETTDTQEKEASDQKEDAQEEPSDKEYVDDNGKGLIKGSSSGIYHVPESPYYDRTTNPEAWFKTIEEAENEGYRAPD